MKKKLGALTRFESSRWGTVLVIHEGRNPPAAKKLREGEDRAAAKPDDKSAEIRHTSRNSAKIFAGANKTDSGS